MSDKDSQPLSGKDLARKPRGFPDKREDLIHAQAELVGKVTAIYRQWGFEALDTGAFEYADALGKFLPDDDRPNAGVFSLQDDDEQWISLRYDLTAPLARFVAEAGQSLGKPFRRYAAGPVWRNEKPGPGRFPRILAVRRGLGGCAGLPCRCRDDRNGRRSPPRRGHGDR
jgi:histidyl-tRNA synthetase